MSKDNPGWVRRNVQAMTHPEEQTAAQGRRARWTVVALLAALVLAGGGVWALRVFVFEPSQAASPQNSSSSSPTSPAASQKPGAETCELDNTPKDISTSPPQATRWVVDRWAAVPEVEGAGPCTDRGGFKVGYAQTETGALLASYRYLVQGNADAPDTKTKGLLEYSLLDGPLKESILQHVDDVNNGVKVRVPDDNFSGVQFLGYRIVGFDKTQAVIELLLGQPDSSSGSLTVKYVWDKGDWRIDPASANEWASPQRNVSSQGFVAWTPQAGGQ